VGGDLEGFHGFLACFHEAVQDQHCLQVLFHALLAKEADDVVCAIGLEFDQIAGASIIMVGFH
jgi:hypothetical protein